MIMSFRSIPLWRSGSEIMDFISQAQAVQLQNPEGNLRHYGWFCIVQKKVGQKCTQAQACYLSTQPIPGSQATRPWKAASTGRLTATCMPVETALLQQVLWQMEVSHIATSRHTYHFIILCSLARFLPRENHLFCSLLILHLLEKCSSPTFLPLNKSHTTVSLSVTWPLVQHHHCKTIEIHTMKISWRPSHNPHVTSAFHLFLPFLMSIFTVTFICHCSSPFLCSLSLALLPTYIFAS